MSHEYLEYSTLGEVLVVAQQLVRILDIIVVREANEVVVVVLPIRADRVAIVKSQEALEHTDDLVEYILVDALPRHIVQAESPNLLDLIDRLSGGLAACRQQEALHLQLN